LATAVADYVISSRSRIEQGWVGLCRTGGKQAGSRAAKRVQLLQTQEGTASATMHRRLSNHKLEKSTTLVQKTQQKVPKFHVNPWSKSQKPLPMCVTHEVHQAGGHKNTTCAHLL
jgi:hypothetical protein